MKVPDGRDVDEASLALGETLGSGGQGTVLRVVGHPDGLVFKRYKGGEKPNADVMRKLVDMPSTLPPHNRKLLLAAAAWPLARVMRQGQLQGFLMQQVPDRFFGLKANGDRQLRELQYLLFPAKPLWGDIAPRSVSAAARLDLAAQFARFIWLMHGRRLVVGDISMLNVMWAVTPPEIFIIDCDGIREAGSAAVLRQAQTPDWNDPLQPPGEPPSLDTDCYKLALLAGRVLCADAHLRPGKPLDLPLGLSAPVVERVGSLWQQAAGPAGTRPNASDWLTALEGRRKIMLPPA